MPRSATALEREGLDAFLQQWLAQPLFASLPSRAAGLDDRRRNTVDGLAWSLRSCGTGAQQPLWDRLGSLAMPVLVMAGEHDERFAAIGRRMVQAMGDERHVRYLCPVPGTPPTWSSPRCSSSCCEPGWPASTWPRGR